MTYLVTSKSNDAVQCYKADGIEYYIVAGTGETGMSRSGLARLCGVGENSVRNRMSKIALEATAGAGSWFAKTARNNAKIINESICSDTIIYYAQQGRHQAVNTLAKMAQAGFRAYVYSQCGYSFEVKPAAPAQTTPALPDFTNPAIAARAWADEVEAKEDALKLAAKTNYKNEKLVEAIQELEGEHEDVTLTEPAKQG